ncbi:adenosine deaminase [Cellulomonas wangsupingiae]|uniref:adenosine deaminase n=1 Tax=Cellulomonas wangsupingiae TaxID=2968085 RepID=A0ABY5K6Q5_9CELL|nr:adenosine deaminase [Cellulomonas wangsupingiae]MCC2334470.1 adenosine deaminase [Cellulomonas wangsupingiae]UUI66132.1 adenosine deaminase [Cellulomonas wangsupingiae]
MTQPAQTGDLDAALVALPKVLLHDHLDGGPRPTTIVELAAGIGHELPTTDPQELGRWFVDAAGSGSLPRYLETFVHTLAVMQTADGLRRVAREAVLDLAADGVVYAEERYAPEQHQQRGLTLQQVVDAVREGFAEGEAQARAAGREIRVVQVLSAMRQADRAGEIAQLALANRDAGVVAFDIAGPEDGFPPSRHASAFRTVRDASFPATVHAGEDGGLESMAEALHVAGAVRLGHGVRIADDVHAAPDGSWRLGVLAHWVRDRRVPLEVCPSSNLQTGAAASIADHPVTTLRRAGFEVTVNTDNRLQSGTSLSRELGLLVREAGWSLDDVVDVTVTAARHTFLHDDERRALVERIVRPAAPGTAHAGRHRA